MPGQRGQESAPFELLVAIVVMTFVLIIGTQALQTLADEKCKGEIEAELESVKTAIETVAKGQGKRNITVNFPTCFGAEETTVRIVEREDSRLCAIHCGGSQSLCTTLVYSNPQYTETKCLRISPNTQFSDLDSVCNPNDVATEGNTYQPIDFKQAGVADGRYILLSRLSATSSFPIVCAYQRQDVFS